MNNRKLKFQKKLAFVMAAACVMVSVTGCQNTKEEVLDENIYVEASLPEQGSLALQNEFIGTVSPEEAVYVVPLVSAEVLSSGIQVGDSVNAGDVLCSLDSEAAKLQLESAQASYNTAQANAKQTLGGSQALQDYQAQSGINQLEKQVKDINENLTDSKNDYTDSSNDLDAVSLWEDDAEENYQNAAKNYNVANAMSTKFSEFKGSSIGKDYAGTMDLDSACRLADEKEKAANKIIQDRTAEIGKLMEELKALDETDPANASRIEQINQAITEHKKAMEAVSNDILAAKTVQGIRSAAKEAGFSSSDLTSSGLAILSNRMTMAQAEYQNAATQKATLEAKKDGYDKAVDQLEDSLDSLNDNLQTAKDTKSIQETQVKPQTEEIVSAQLEAAGIGIKSAQMQLDMYTLTAPISGVVEAVNVTEHGFATSGSAAYVISNKETMTVNFTVSEGIRNTLQIGQKISVERNGNIYDGVITEIGSMVDSQTGLFKIKANVAADGNSLLTGSSVKITADTYHEEDTLILPYDAVYYESGQAYVYVAESGTAVRKNVEPGIFNDTSIVILSGITAQDQVITSWASNLREGARVVVKEKEKTAAETKNTEPQTESGPEEETTAASEAAE